MQQPPLVYIIPPVIKPPIIQPPIVQPPIIIPPRIIQPLIVQQIHMPPQQEGAARETSLAEHEGGRRPFMPLAAEQSVATDQEGGAAKQQQLQTYINSISSTPVFTVPQNIMLQTIVHVMPAEPVNFVLPITSQPTMPPAPISMPTVSLPPVFSPLCRRRRRTPRIFSRCRARVRGPTRESDAEQRGYGSAGMPTALTGATSGNDKSTGCPTVA